MSEAFSLAQIVSVQADRYVDEVANSDRIVSAAVDEALRCEQEGLLPALDADAMRRAVWERQVRRLLKRGQKEVQSDLSEQSGLNLGREFDVPLLVCGHKALRELGLSVSRVGRSTTLGNLRADDIDLMNLEQDIHLREANAKREKDRPNMESNRDLLRGFRNYRAFRERADGAA